MNRFLRILLIGFCASLIFPSLSFSKAVIKKVEITSSGEVTLSYEGSLNLGSVSTDYQNDIIQLTLNDAAIYPAKIISGEGGLVTKAFTYQYSPNVVRCRLSIHGKAEDFRGRVQLQSSNHHFKIKVQSTAPAVKSQELLDEKLLQEKVLKTVAVTEVKVQEPKVQEPVQVVEKAVEKRVLGGAKPLPSFGKVLVKLAAVIALIGFLALLTKKGAFLKGLRKNSPTEIVTAFHRLVQGSVPAREKMIEIVSSQYLAPKKSLVVVRVAGKLLVLGLSQDSIHLLTQISDTVDDAALEGDEVADASQKGAVSFSEVFGEEKTTAAPEIAMGVRSRIRSRLEGLKQL